MANLPSATTARIPILPGVTACSLNDGRSAVLLSNGATIEETLLTIDVFNRSRPLTFVTDDTGIQVGREWSDFIRALCAICFSSERGAQEELALDWLGTLAVRGLADVRRHDFPSSEVSP